MKHVLTTLVLCLLFNVAQAQIGPRDGLWWNPEESGRGIFIETQDDITVAAFYHYDSSGNNQWWLVAGRLSTNNRGNFELNGRWNRFTGGQCPACNWRQANASDAGAVTIEFIDDINAVMYWQGGVTPLQRQYWAYDSLLEMMMGAWDNITGVDGSVLIASGLILYDLRGEDLWGVDDQGGTVLANYVESGNYIAIIDDTPTSYTLYLAVFLRDKSYIAWYWLEKDGQLPQGDPDGVARGYRWASRNAVTGGSGPYWKQNWTEDREQSWGLLKGQAAKKGREMLSLPKPDKAVFARLQTKLLQKR